MFYWWCVCFELNESAEGWGNRDNTAEAEPGVIFVQEIRRKLVALVSSGRRHPPTAAL